METLDLLEDLANHLGVLRAQANEQFDAINKNEAGRNEFRQIGEMGERNGRLHVINNVLEWIAARIEDMD